MLSPSVATLLIEIHDAHNKGGLVEAEPNADDAAHGTTELVDALRPLVLAAAVNSDLPGGVIMLF